LRGSILTRSGRVYNSEKVEKTIEALTIAVSQQGYAFGRVRPASSATRRVTLGIVYVIRKKARGSISSASTSSAISAPRTR
jgi:outer membrane protein insertion porin family